MTNVEKYNFLKNYIADDKSANPSVARKALVALADMRADFLTDADAEELNYKEKALAILKANALLFTWSFSP